MLNRLLILFFVVFSIAACSDDDSVEPTVVDTSLPQGTFTSTLSGTFVGQSGVNSTGNADLGTDSEGTQFIRFSQDFDTNLNTGTVTVYLSTSENFVTDPANGNPDLRIIGVVSGAGEQFFKVDPGAGANFTHVILWCASANIPFGFAALN